MYVRNSYHVFGAGAALFAVARVQDVRAQVEINVDTFGAVDDLVTDRGPGRRVVNVHIRALHLSTQGVSERSEVREDRSSKCE